MEYEGFFKSNAQVGSTEDWMTQCYRDSEVKNILLCLWAVTMRGSTPHRMKSMNVLFFFSRFYLNYFYVCAYRNYSSYIVITKHF